MKSGFKKFLISLFLTAGCIFCMFAAGADKIKETPISWMSSIKRGTLSNGMQYYILKNSQPENRISLRLAVKAGSAMEDEDQKGVAHFVEHMCFNGTKNFEKNSIIDYFESIGMAFGPEVNAYTSFEETVYMLEIPADNPDIIAKSFQVLKEWANEVSFDQIELDKERKVINEEWRIGTGLNGRYSNSLVEFLYRDSQFAKRLPIGDMKIINSVSRQRVVDFYKKWYRPEFMAIIAVGDIDPAVLEKAIKESVGTIPASDKTVSLPNYIVPSNTAKKVKFFKDKEMPYDQIGIFVRDETYKPLTNERQMYEMHVLNLFSQIFNQRLSEITNSVDSPWLGASVQNLNETRKECFKFASIVPKTGKDVESIKKMIDELERFMVFGATDEEIARFKKANLDNADHSVKNKDKKESSNWASSIVWAYLNNAPVYGFEKDAAYTKKYIKQITNEDLKDVAKKMFKSRGESLFLAAPVNSTVVPSEKQLLDVWSNYESAEILEYKENNPVTTLMDKPSSKGKVVTSVKNTKLGTIEYTFDNGIKLITKKTKNVKNSLSINALSNNGTSYISDKDYPSSQFIFNYALLSGLGDVNYTQLQKILTDKQISINSNLSFTSNSITASSTKKDVEYALQCINLMFTKPRFTDEGWKILMDTVNQIAQGHGSKVNDVFTDKVRELLFGNSIRFAPLDLNYVKKLVQATAEKIYRQIYKDPSDYTFIVVGDFDEKSFVDLFASYLGSLITERNPKERKYIPAGFKGKKEATVKKGTEKQGLLDICFYGTTETEDPYTEDNNIYAATQLLNILLREIIREDMGGSYSVGLTHAMRGVNPYDYIIEIYTSCDPLRGREIKNAALAEIERLKKELTTPENIQKIKEAYIRTRETNLKNNSWIMDVLCGFYFYKDCPEDLFQKDDFIELITAENIQKTIIKYCNTNNMSTVYLVPEK
ncbi:MAG: insulinase family protein [Treponema sp.]|nr:insulinase family protein [Treponema sp.]